ncbi:glycosyltransferase family 4 protein [uncultured Halomonas sp.]|uniref:glycosyltransferase family 4 protein n=1 Tax=uncultured Halomonas sp. TaxID=173971 RepID=UPI00262789F7|nr:glycosyltransferase family 4 protein [uncultured Halomonas sp.]
MRLLVTANQTPFVAGGANHHVEGLVAALREHGHQVECLRLPFHYDEHHIRRQMAYAEGLEVRAPNDVAVDRVISLQFPGYGVSHPEHVVWLMHQHRVCYELYDPTAASAALRELRPEVEAYDARHLARARWLFANSPRVAERLREHSGLTAEPLYHPPHQAERFTCADDWGYVFYPSRLEPLKRQALLIQAVALCREPVRLLLAGQGSQGPALAALIEKLGVADRVCLLGHIGEAEKLTLYAHATAVAFPSFDEDYGYITLEAMLSAKPVITCTDSGGPLAFVEPGVTGWISEPTPEAMAVALEEAWSHRARSREMGRAGRSAYAEKQITWPRVVERLLQPA